tara:strand:+ start:6135 stop:6749 length:615 start_codon:yes stop_codon:yes gene_type:complete
MFALVKDNKIEKIFTRPTGFMIDDNQYPREVFTLWTDEERKNIGIYEVITDSTNKKDESYYINTNEEFNFNNQQVTRSWGTATPKRLDDEDAKDEDGNNILDDDGNQVINYGLKTEKKRIVKQQASGLLNPTDWYVIKATEVESYNVPENITNFRAEVRTTSNEMETKIDACNSVDELKSLYEYTKQDDGSVTRPLGEFPKEVV